MASNNSQSAYAAGSGAIWFIGWLFTIGFAGLPFWQGALGLLVWPYYLGVALT